jgi:hypothetical protein
VTHNVEEGLAVASHAAVMTTGRIVRREACSGGTLDVRRFLADYRALVVGDGAGRADDADRPRADVTAGFEASA